ncbi:MAG: hypothetical protein J7604_02005 [Sporocytophaga sp.]|uniref:hypothetical protein n=1 Tax=Sporocytophaga sp. TaxID=2231183 RepID=UPI001B04F5CD|nr:hypothetical protein [Sporocytophaga sp.]MBO9698949.1 hypothetical protein [Sporocytophaga sp.]
MKFKINILKFLLGIALAFPLLAYNITVKSTDGIHNESKVKDVAASDDDTGKTIITSFEAVIPFVQINLHQDILFEFLSPIIILQNHFEEKVDLPDYVNKYFRILLQLIITPQAP